MKTNTEKVKTKGKNLNMRLDDATANRLEEIMQARSLNKTDAVKFCIHNIPILKIGNVSSLATEFYKIRLALENNSDAEKIRQEVNALCLSISALIAKVETSRK